MIYTRLLLLRAGFSMLDLFSRVPVLLYLPNRLLLLRKQTMMNGHQMPEVFSSSLADRVTLDVADAMRTHDLEGVARSKHLLLSLNDCLPFLLLLWLNGKALREPYRTVPLPRERLVSVLEPLSLDLCKTLVCFSLSLSGR